MTINVKNTILASLFLGATVFGMTAASAAPLSNTALNVQSEIVRSELGDKSAAKPVEFLLGLGIGALLGGVAVHHHDHHGYHWPWHSRRHGRYHAWSSAWSRDCARRYRTFNPRTGYYISRRYGRTFCR